mmetsp:Transcript_2978/g.2455  ORF Transcript_2978/g.2455 Transcript_2978/m.2455 type:complete len:135 (-) Transcript_2978:29-433(-)
MNIPNLQPCRLSNLKTIQDQKETFEYESIRVFGKVISFEMSAKSAIISNEGSSLIIDISLVPEKEMIIKKKYEFLGELKKNEDNETVLEVRTFRPIVDSHDKNLYEITSKLLNKLIDSYGTNKVGEEVPMEVDG